MKEIIANENIFHDNDKIADELRTIFKERKILTINFLGSPGAGKTRLLEKLINSMKDKISISVIEGDLYTSKDSQRIEKQGVNVIQINTVGGCHLDAPMIKKSINYINIEKTDLIIIENVGNLVCPASYDLGEDMRVLVMSVTEGNDKPLKYPTMFQKASLVIINKMDLIEYTDFNLMDFYRDLYLVNPHVKVIETSCTKNLGINKVAQGLYHEIKIKKNESI